MLEFNLKDILNIEDDYVFNLLGIENFNNPHTRLRFWFKHLMENHERIEGDIFEFGVYQGHSLISMALLLKKIRSKKKIFGFDSFSGFPSYHEKDDLSMFKKYEGEIFETELVEKHRLLMKIKALKGSKTITPENISDSSDFSDNSLKGLQNKIDILALDNIELIEGAFDKTLPSFSKNFLGSIFSANIDCDLYEGYKAVLPFVYKNLEPKGYVHLDEYYSLKFPGARIACKEFFDLHNIHPLRHPREEHEFERWYFTK